MYQPPQSAGIRFRTIYTPEDPSLPRMDIAGFVGYAAQGPVDVPVAVEDVRRFREIFGPDPALAWDAEESRFETAHLGASVEAFLAAGGRRAHVVRVAGPGAQAARFGIPGLLGDMDGEPARLEARAPGRWANALRIEAALDRRRIRISAAPGFSLAAPLRVLGGSDALAPGDLLELRFAGETLSAFLPVTARQDDGTFALGAPWWVEGDPYGGEDLLAVADAAGAARFAGWQAASPTVAPALFLLRMTLSAQTGDGPVQRLRDMALGAAHPRWFGHLLPDHLALAPRDDRFGPRPDPARESFLQEALVPRFALAGSPSGTQNQFWLPRSLSTTHAVDRTRNGADGLDDFSADDFLDPDLRRAGSGALRAEADEKILVRNAAATGLHALWPVEEIALIAVPDAVHRPWLRAAPPPQDLPAAPVLSPPVPHGQDRVAVTWTAVPDASAYTVEMAGAPDFASVLVTETVQGADTVLNLPSNCPQKLFFRVRGQVGGGITPWSNTRGDWLPGELAAPCGRPSIRHLTLSASPVGSPDESFVLHWGGLATVEIEADAGPGFENAATRFAGTAVEWMEDQPVGAGLFLRARHVVPGGPQPWSNTVFIPPLPRSDFTLLTEREYDGVDLVTLHSALLRFCAARGDLTAALAVAAFADPVTHLAALRPVAGSPATTAAGVPPLTTGERDVFGFGALLHPWLLISDGETVRPRPPDGLALGHAAAAARGPGAWTSAANRRFEGVLGLTEIPGLQTRLEWEAAGLNPVLKDARGYLTLSDWTLSDDSALRHMTIRRLLVLLRRLALREGRAMVFEPNGAPLRELVQSRFDRFMERLYLRGAFQGRTPDEAFRVITDRSVNLPGSIDAGRFVAELRVAPSRPLAFLRVQLFQTASAGFATREITA
jgi:hypothetical protein